MKRLGAAAVLVVVLVGQAAVVAPIAYGLHLVWPVWGALVPFVVWSCLVPVLHRAAPHSFRAPTGPERIRLERPWAGALRRAGLRDGSYRLMVIDSEALNACAPAGRIVAVTSHAARSLSAERLQAVLAHELAHRRGAPAPHRAVLLPSRTLWWLLRALWSPVAPLWRRAVAWRRPIGFLMVFLLVIVATAVTVVAALPAAIAYATSALTRLSTGHAETRADAAAARLGVGPDLLAAIEHHIQGSAKLPAALARRADRLRRALAAQGP